MAHEIPLLLTVTSPASHYGSWKAELTKLIFEYINTSIPSIIPIMVRFNKLNFISLLSILPLLKLQAELNPSLVQRRKMLPLRPHRQRCMVLKFQVKEED